MKGLVILALGALLLFAVACTGDDDDMATPVPGTETPTSVPDDPTPTPTKEPPEGEAPQGLYGHGKRTGVAEIDRILEAWENGDVARLTVLALMQEQQCTTNVQGAGGPPECPTGVDDGTTVEVFKAADCEGYWVYEDRLDRLFRGFVEGTGGMPYYLYAAWRSDGDAYLTAGYRVQFARSVADFDVFSPQLVLKDDGKIQAYFSGCSPAPIQVPAGADFVLEPKEGAPTSTRIPAVDNFLTIRQKADVTALMNLVTFTPVACKLPSEATYYVHCSDGQPSGTVVDAWPWWGCHGAWSNVGTKEQIAEFFATYTGEIAMVLRFEPSGTVDMFPAQASLAVIFKYSDEQAWAAILDDDGNFYGMVSGCPLDVEGLSEFHFGGADVLWEGNGTATPSGFAMPSACQVAGPPESGAEGLLTWTIRCEDSEHVFSPDEARPLLTGVLHDGGWTECGAAAGTAYFRKVDRITTLAFATDDKLGPHFGEVYLGQKDRTVECP